MAQTRSAADLAAWLEQRQAPARRYITAAAVAGTLAGLATIVQLGVMAGIAYSVLVTRVPAVPLFWLAGAGVIAILVRSLANRWQLRSAAKASDAVRSNLRAELLEHWGRLGPLETGATSAGTLASEWLDQVDALHGYYARFQPQRVLCITVPLMIVAVVLWLDWLAALFLLLSAPLIPLFMALVGMGAEKLNQQHMETLGRLSGHFLDQVRGLTTLQLFGATDSATRAIGDITDDYRKINLKTLRVAFLSSAVLEFFASVAIAVIAIYIGFGLLGYIDYGPSPDLTLFSGLFILLLAPEFFQPLRQLAQHYHDRATALGAAAQLQARLETKANQHAEHASEPSQRPSQPSSQQTAQEQSPVVVSGLGVTAGDNDRWLLADINLTVPPGQWIAITGPSGSGKSTLLDTLAGFRRATVGSVLISGQKPGQSAIGWLGQSPFIRQGSWADNLRVAAPKASDQELMTALSEVGLATLVESRRDGLASVVSEDGTGLSGGQARRLALARVFLARHSLVLLDEPTSGLDPGSAAVIISALANLQRQGVTVIVATHHPALMDAADRVLKLANGRLLNA